MINPKDCIPPHRVSYPNKVIDLANKFVKKGWGKYHLPLIGYYINKKLQLLSGTHRHAAAIMAGLDRIPVLIRGIKEVKDAYGNLKKWEKLMDAKRDVGQEAGR